MKFQVIAPLLLASGVNCWGSLGHATIAYIATDFMTADAATKFQTILGDTSADYLASVASWADSYRYTTAGTFSKPFHYIDALDSPPTTCGVDYSRDCGIGGCVVSAISNYTTRVQDGRLSAANLAIAAKMLVHFIGDIHQPLHDENLDTGGNGVAVTYNGVATNLHAIWDTNMPETYTSGGYALTDARAWATTLTTAIKTGTYKSAAAGWLTGLDITDGVTSSMIWAKDANAYVCSTVMPNGLSAVESVDLSGVYYTAALPVIKLQFAKAGYRLAAWLNAAAAGI